MVVKHGAAPRRVSTHHGGGLLRGGTEEGGEGREERAAYQVHKHVGREAIGRPAPGHGHGGCGNRAAIWPRPRPSPAHPPHHLLLPLLLALPLLLLTLAGRWGRRLTELPVPSRRARLIRLWEAGGHSGALRSLGTARRKDTFLGASFPPFHEAERTGTK